jgi:hypothetical protein
MKANEERSAVMSFSITPVAVADYFESRIRHARIARSRAKLRRELARLPKYVADDIIAAADLDRPVNYLDS